jgi:hypothetical protein
MSSPLQWSVEYPICHAVLHLDRGILILPKHPDRDVPTLNCPGEGLVGTERPPG